MGFSATGFLPAGYQIKDTMMEKDDGNMVSIKDVAKEAGRFRHHGFGGCQRAGLRETRHPGTGAGGD